MAIARLHILQDMGIACAGVSHLSAELGDARRIYHDGIVSVTNARAEGLGVRAGMAAKEAAALMLNSPAEAGEVEAQTIEGEGFSARQHQ